MSTTSRSRSAPTGELVAHTRVGAGPPLVLIHPLGADRGVWDPLLEHLAASREVFAIDLPGFGSSRPLPEPLEPSPAGLARAVARLLDDLGFQRAHIAGNSLGGWVALELALTGRALSVTALSPAGLWSRPLAPKRPVARYAARAALPLLPLLSHGPGRSLILAGSVARPRDVPPAAAARLVRSYAQAPGFERANALMRAGRFEGLELLRVPVMLAWAERDRLVGPPASTPRGVRNVLLRGCGHIPMWDDPELVARVLIEGSDHPSV